MSRTRRCFRELQPMNWGRRSERKMRHAGELRSAGISRWVSGRRFQQAEALPQPACQYRAFANATQPSSTLRLPELAQQSIAVRRPIQRALRRLWLEQVAAHATASKQTFQVQFIPAHAPAACRHAAAVASLRGRSGTGRLAPAYFATGASSASCSSRHRIFPLADFGSAGTKLIAHGTL